MFSFLASSATKDLLEKYHGDQDTVDSIIQEKAPG